MTKVPQGFDFSFLNEEEARKILQVLERNEELRRAEKDRISKLQKTKRDIRWLQGATGEWFEEIQRKKFCNETDVNQMLKLPLTCRLQKGMAKNDPMELQTSRSKNLMNQKPSVSPRMSFRSSFASLFSFRRSGKETPKLQSQRLRGCNDPVEPSVSLRGTTAAIIHSSPVGSQPVARAFVPKPAIMREESGLPPPWDDSLLESEFFQVLDDLDSKLAQEQPAGLVNTRVPFNYGSRTQIKYSHSSRNRHSPITGRHQNYHSETSNMSIYDILRPGTPREGFKTFSPRTKTIYDMYRTREPRGFKEDFMQKNTFGSTSLCFDSRQRSASPAAGRFTARSLHFPADPQNKSSFTPVRHQQSPKRTPLSSIIWNRPDSSRYRQNQEESAGVPSPMDIDPAEQYVSPECFQESRRYESYHSQGAYQSFPFSAPMGDAMSPDTLENSENVPFYHQNNPFARSLFSSTFRQSREQRFGQNSFWSQQEEHSSWSDFPHSRKSFPPSEKDFEMISVETNPVPSVWSHAAPCQHWRPRSPGYGTYVFGGREDPRCWRSDFQVSPLESMDTSLVNENQFPPHFVTPDGFFITGSSCHIQSSGTDSRQGHCPTQHFPMEAAVDEAQTLVSSSRSPSPLIPDNQRGSQSPSSQNSTVTLQTMVPNKPDPLPIRSCAEVPVACSRLTPETQSNIPATEMNSETDRNESISEGEQLNKTDQKNKPSGLLQPVSQSVIANDLPDFQNAHSGDSTQNDRHGFNASATVSSRRSPRVFSRKGTSQIHTTQREKGNELSKNKCFPGNRKLDAAASLPFTQESGTPPPLSPPSPRPGCHQKNEDSSSTIQNSPWCFEPIANQDPQPPEEPDSLDDLDEQQCPPAHSNNGSRLATGHGGSRDPLGVSSDAHQGSVPSRDSFLDAFGVPSTAVFFSRSLSDQEPSLERREEKDKARKNQNDQLSVSPADNRETDDGPALPHDAGRGHSYSPFRSGRDKGRVRRRVSYIEKLTKTESRAAATSEGINLAEDQGSGKAAELSTVYCTLPRNSASFHIHSRQPQSKVMAASLRNGPLPFQVKNKAEVPTEKDTSDKPGSPESMTDASNSVVGTPEATKRMTDMKAIRSASVRKGPLPFLIKRATSCPSGDPCTLAESGEREKPPVLHRDVSAVTPRPGGTFYNSLDGDLSCRESTFSERHNQKELAQGHTGKHGEIPARRVSSFTLSNRAPEPLCTVGSGKESGQALHKFKTTSMFSVSGDEENVKCLEVVSIYYTLPRKPSKKFCSLLQQYAQGTDLLRDAFQGEFKALPDALESDEPNCPSRVQSGTPPLQDQRRQVESAPCCLSHSTENKAVSQLLNREAPGSTLEEMAPARPDVSLHQGEPKTKETFPGNISKATVGDSLSRKKKGGELIRQILQTPLLLKEKSAGEENTKSHQQPSKGRHRAPPGLPSHSEDNVENSQTRRNPGTRAGGMAITSTGNGRRPWRDDLAVVVGDSSDGSQPRETSGTTGSDCQKLTDKMPSDSQSQAFALPPALHKLQLPEGAKTRGVDLQLESGQAGSQETNTAETRELEDETQKLAWDQTLLPGGSTTNKTNTGDLGTKADRYSVKHRLAAISKASRKIPAKDLSPRKHVATIFSQSESKPGFMGLSLCRAEDSPPSSEPPVQSTESTDESTPRIVDKSETLLQATEISNPHQNESNGVLETAPKSRASKAQISGESGAPAQLMLTSPLEKSSDQQQRLSPPLPLDPAQKSTINSHCQLRHKSAPSPELESAPHLYRSKSLKNFYAHGDRLCISHPPKARGRHFSENTSIDSALSQLSLEEDSSHNSGYSRRFKSFSELPASHESESWALYNNRTRGGPKSTSSISRPIDYGIFGKEQQLAFLENVKRSLTQGRLWKPSFLKNPGFLKDDVLNASNLSQSELLDSPGGQAPEEGLFPSEPLNIYKEDPVEPVDSDWDTDTTTDDEYYLDENDKESEL
ncbi:exophilin-5 [Acomys russatus]|uniref:exophilin-5 n=1 Tax=Acomys russatus TaxID=60746 RepID=UPI0021E2D7A9|nr:exophilin-5 [Acomys russatus]